MIIRGYRFQIKEGTVLLILFLSLKTEMIEFSRNPCFIKVLFYRFLFRLENELKLDFDGVLGRTPAAVKPGRTPECFSRARRKINILMHL